VKLSVNLSMKVRNAAAKLNGDPPNDTGYCPAKKPTPNRAFELTSVNKWRKTNDMATVFAIECFHLHE
jgi:hypothetical protein